MLQANWFDRAVGSMHLEPVRKKDHDSVSMHAGVCECLTIKHYRLFLKDCKGAVPIRHRQ